MPKRVDAAALRGEIRAAARRVFAQRGVEGTGLVHVADAAGMGRSSLYHYYPDKDALLRDLLREALDDEAALFERELAAEGAPLERIARLARALAATFDDWAATGRLLLDLRLRDAPRFRPFFRDLRARLGAVVAAGQARGEIDASLDPQMAAALVVGAVDGLLFQHWIDRRAFPDAASLAAALERAVRKVLAP